MNWKNCPTCGAIFRPKTKKQKSCSRRCSDSNNGGGRPTDHQRSEHQLAVSTTERFVAANRTLLPPDPDDLGAAVREFLNSGGEISQFAPSQEVIGEKPLLEVAWQSGEEVGPDLSHSPQRHPLLYEEGL
jgi:hypothetical protein